MAYPAHVESSPPAPNGRDGEPSDTASWPRRSLALLIDWLASTLVVIALVGRSEWSGNAAGGFWTTGVFLLETTVLTAIAGGSFGKLITGIRVVRLQDGRPPNLLQSLLRSGLVCLVVPPLIFKPDGRGLHDIWTRTRTVVPRRRVGEDT